MSDNKMNVILFGMFLVFLLLILPVFPNLNQKGIPEKEKFISPQSGKSTYIGDTPDGDQIWITKIKPSPTPVSE